MLLSSLPLFFFFQRRMNATYETRGIKRSCGMRRDKKEQKKWTAVVTIYVISHPNHIQFTLSWNNILTEGKISRAVQDVGKGNQNSFKRK